MDLGTDDINAPVRTRRGLARLTEPAFWGERRARRRIDQTCVGYSLEAHWDFFRHILSQRPIRRVCVLGVYHGRDIAYIASILERLRRTEYHITGVDRFEDSACEDWPEDVRHLNWSEAGFGAAPTLEATRRNLEELRLAEHVTLHRGLGEAFLDSTPERFDLIYIDTSHDYKTVKQEIDRAVPRVTPEGLVAGDDFSDEDTWGVARAVRDSFASFRVHDDWIWWADPKAYRG